MTIEREPRFDIHIYYVDHPAALEHLTHFITQQLEPLLGEPVEGVSQNLLLFEGVGKSCHFGVWTMVEPGVCSKLDMVLQLGRLTEDNGVLSKANDLYVILSATWENHKLENERVVMEACFNPTDDWFPILVGMFSPIVSAGVNSALVRLGL